MLQEEESWGGVKDGNYNMKKIRVAGLGPGNPDYILPAVRKAAEDSDIIIGGRRNIESIKELLEGKEGDFFGPAGYCVPPMYRQGLAAAMDKMYEDVTKDIKVTEQDIKDKYDEYVENDKEYYTENPNMFETDYPSGALYYNLGGYRVAKHILIKFDDEYSDKIKEYEELNLYALPYDVKSFKKLQNIYIAYDEISQDDFVNIWGDLLNTPIYYHDKYYHRINVASIYWNCPSIFFFSRKFSEHTLSENLTGFLDTIRKEFVSSMLKKYSTLEEVRNPKNQLYLYYILHRNINEKSMQSFFKNRNYNFGWLKKEKGYKSLFTKGVEDSIEFEDQNPIFQVYNAQFRYSFGINSKNTLDLEKLGIGNKRNPFEELVKWSNF